MKTLQQELDQRTAAAEIFQNENQKTRCLACGHRCLLGEGRRGICKVRFVKDGILKMPWGYVSGLQVDPIEKKPFFHFLPGSNALTFGMLGCDFHCGFCQNWVSSQALKDPATQEYGFSIREIDVETVAETAMRYGADSIISSYNEPFITVEWAKEIFRAAKSHGKMTAMVSNGYATREALDFIRPYLDAIKIDLKSMQQSTYRELGGVLSRTIDTIRYAHQCGLWLEIVTLLIPGLNDSPHELSDAAQFIRTVSADIPWHITAYHPDYKFRKNRATTSSDLIHAAEIAKDAGVRFVYAGNIPGQTGDWEDTICPTCKKPLIQRIGFAIKKNNLKPDGSCPNCGNFIAGIWRTQLLT